MLVSTIVRSGHHFIAWRLPTQAVGQPRAPRFPARAPRRRQTFNTGLSVPANADRRGV
jgi:hypothetical protein